jgi:hypothetical protein
MEAKVKVISIRRFGIEVVLVLRQPANDDKPTARRAIKSFAGVQGIKNYK